MARLRVLLLTPSIPSIYDGGMLRVLSLVQRLSPSVDFSLLTFARRAGPNPFRDDALALAMRDLFSQIYLVPKESTEEVQPGQEGLPSMAREFRSAEMAAKLRKVTAEGLVDIVHVEFLPMASYVHDVVNVPTVITEHDLSHLSLFHSYFREWTGWRRLREIPEWLRVRRYHRSACRKADRLVALTSDDCRKLAKVVSLDKIAHVPTCVDLRRFSFRSEIERAPSRDIAFVGHYPHYPNEDAAVWLCREVLPLVRNVRRDVSASLIGSYPTPAVKALEGSGVEVTGTVPEITPFLDRCRIFAASVRLGYGIKGKVLEAFSRGLPVVATSVVARGIPECRAGEHLLIADRPESFAKAVLLLLQDANLRERLSRNARALVECYYGWESSCRTLEKLYNDVSKIKVVNPTKERSAWQERQSIGLENSSA